MIVRRLEPCETCFGSDTTARGIFDCDTIARTKTCRCCRTVKPMRAPSASVVAKRAAWDAEMERLIAELIA